MNALKTRSPAGRLVVLATMTLLAAMSMIGRADPVPPPRPTSAWLLDEGAGANLRPAAGNGIGQIGGFTGVPAPTWSTYTPFSYPDNHSLQFVASSGSNPSNWAYVAGTPKGTAGTISFWVADDNTGGRYMLDATDGHRTLIYRSGSVFSVFVNQSSVGSFPAAQIPNDSSWTHLALVWDNSLPTDKQKIYKNGNPTPIFTSNTTLGAVNPATIWLGSRFSQNESWGGWIDEYASWDVPLSTDQIAWLASNSVRAVAAPPPVEIPPIPADAWFFDEGAGGAGTITKPRWGNNPGTLYSNVGWTTNTPFVYEGNSALWFDGTIDNRVNFGSHTFGTQGSISIWAYRLPGAQYLFDASPGGRTLLYSTFALYMNDVYIGNIPNLLTDNQWTHLVITWDSSLPTEKEKIYKNGQLFATFNTALSAKTPAMLWLGNRYSNNERWYGGIDEYALWHQVLTPEQVAWLFRYSLRELPEPSTLVLLGLGGLGLAGGAVRRKRWARVAGSRR